MVKLAERDFGGDSAAPVDDSADAWIAAPADRSQQSLGPGDLGLTVIEIDETNAHRFDVPAG